MAASSMKELFLSVIERAKKKYSFAVENFCILGNHFHLILQPLGGASLSVIMQWIMSVFAMAWNKIHGLTGHVWGSRFFSRVLANFHQYQVAFAYVSNNPVQAGLVQHAEDWPFGGPWHFRRRLFSILDRPDLRSF